MMSYMIFIYRNLQEYDISNKHKCKQHFCLNFLQGFHYKESRDKHFEYCKDNIAVRIEMPKEGSFMDFHDGQNQFKVPKFFSHTT